MSLWKTTKQLRVKNKDIFPVPSIDLIIRLGKIPRVNGERNYWIPVWKISRKYSERKVKTITSMLEDKLNNFAVAFENEEKYVILSDRSLDITDADDITAKLNEGAD